MLFRYTSSMKLFRILIVIISLLVVQNYATASSSSSSLTSSSRALTSKQLIETTPQTTSIWRNLINFRNWFTAASPASPAAAAAVNKESANIVAESRTFGRIRRLQMALMPILFKFGVISALIGVLVFLGLKTVFLLKALILLNLGVLLVKLIHAKFEHAPIQHYQQPQPLLVAYGGSGWGGGPHTQGWGGAYSNNWQKSSAIDHSKEVHVHIHNDGPSKIDSSSNSHHGNYIYGKADDLWQRIDDRTGSNNNDPYRNHQQAEEELMNSRRGPIHAQYYRSSDATAEYNRRPI